MQYFLFSLIFRKKKKTQTDKEYDKAIEMYTKAIEVDSKNAVYFANRSLAHLRQESFGSALEDGVSAVKVDPSYLKGYYRRAAAQMSLGKFKKALTDFEFVAKRKPNDKDAAMKFTECNKLVKKQAFEKAISNDVPEKTLAELHADLETIGEFWSILCRARVCMLYRELKCFRFLFVYFLFM